MKPRFTNQAEQNQGRQHMQPGWHDNGQPLINWRGIFQRIWLFLKRIISEIWYLLIQRFRTNKTSSTPRKPLLNNKWSIPIFKVAVAITLFMYVMQRDIQFTIEMKAPFGPSSQSLASNYGNTTDQMGFVSPVSLTTGSKENNTNNGSLSVPEVEQYIERFAELAQAEMNKFGIPASVKMAQAILESQAGKSVAVRVDNNHFGAAMAGQPFESPWRNWREHSLLIQHRYPRLLNNGDDYRAWARGLEAVAYNDRPNYANELLEVIERFHLHQLDDSTI